MSRINEEQWGEFLAELNARNAAVQPPATPQEPICGTCGKPASDGDTYVQCGPCHWASTPSPEGQTTWHDRGVQPPATPQEPEPYGPFFDPCGKCVTRTHCAHNDRCLAECVPADLRASAPPDVWQPIETAPKDGTEVLLLWFDAETGAAPMRRVGFWHSREQAWCDTHRVLHNQNSHPTHWMPLPNPPKRHLPSPPTPGGK